ncbi:hypothetical protein EQM13_00490 [Acidilutibacter cellobiosedens]|uniref:Uncharacterized protein n=2 Tax=Acidilutibacter cellobiosedens TaxID=2507161 RepID=A0A410Q8B8_9FIRM|nr:hypothetical protein EQM13_00490 [Acidilutibacter cellobiosedens]
MTANNQGWFKLTAQRTKSSLCRRQSACGVLLRGVVSNRSSRKRRTRVLLYQKLWGQPTCGYTRSNSAAVLILVV